MRLFVGPLFIVGMPRSGTKLLRGLLVQNSEIYIPSVETDFLQTWIRNWSTYGDLSDLSIFDAFYERQKNMTFFVDCEEHIDSRAWFSDCSDYTVQGVFEGLIKQFSKSQASRIYGDKSPSYIDCMPELKEAFPGAKFIHIVRDVRDYSLSVRHTWGKSIVRASSRWADSLAKAGAFGESNPTDYLVVRYEDLLQQPEDVLRKCCDFVGVPFSENMLSLNQNYEPSGATSGNKSIVSNNFSKYKKQMTVRELRRVESLTIDLLKEHEYPTDYQGGMLKVGRFGMLLRQLYDGCAMVRYDVERLGLLKSISYHYQHFRATRGV